MELNLSLWIERRKIDCGLYGGYIIEAVTKYEATIARLTAENEALRAGVERLRKSVECWISDHEKRLVAERARSEAAEARVAELEAPPAITPEALEQVREALAGITDHGELQDPEEYMSKSLNDAIAACSAALALLPKKEG